MAFTDGQVDRSRGAWDKRDGGGLVALAHDPQRAMAALDAEVLNVGGTCLADTKSIQAEKPQTVDSRRSIVEAASPRSSIQARNSSMCARLAASTAMPWSVAHWKKPRRSWRYASSVRPL